MADAKAKLAPLAGQRLERCNGKTRLGGSLDMTFSLI